MNPPNSAVAGDIVPVFPLPSAVLFPGTVLPLYIFEQRYREMTRDAADGSGRIAIALLKPGYEQDYEGSPRFHRLGTVGRIDDLQSLPDGRFRFNLVGLERVSFEEIPSPKTYRLVRVEPRPEREVDDTDAEIVRAKLELLVTQKYLLGELTGDSAELLLDERISFAGAVNGACANLPVEPALRQELLEIDDLRERQHRVMDLAQQVLEAVLRIKGSGAEGAGGPLAN